MRESSNAEKTQKFFFFFKVDTYRFELEGLAVLIPVSHPLSLTTVLRSLRETGVQHSGSECTPGSGVEPGGGSREGGFGWLPHHTIQVPQGQSVRTTCCHLST